MKNKNQNSRRSFLSNAIKGTAVLAVGLSTAPVLESFAFSNPADSDLEFRTKLGNLGTLSLMTSELALTKANNQRVKQFARFEADEQMAIATVLKELATPTPKLDTKGKDVMDKLKSASGAAFDKAYMQAQLDTHQKLRELNEDFIKDNQNKMTMPEMHSRHIARVALATIKEHIELSKMLLGMLG